MISSDPLTEHLWIFTQVGAFRFLLRDDWEELFTRIVKQGWDMTCTGDAGWLQSELNPYPLGALFNDADAKSFALAIREGLSVQTKLSDALAPEILKQVAALFAQGPVLIRAEPPRKTAATGVMEVVYGYSCLTCGFLHSGSWLFNLAELSSEEIRSSVESMLAHTYCPLCGSKDIDAVRFFLKPFDPDDACDMVSRGRETEP